MLNIVFLCGYSRCGKDTLANHLASNHGYIHLKISRPLKDAIKILFNLTEDQVESDLKDSVDTQWNVTPRDIMKFVGTDMFQYKIKDLFPNQGRNFWIDLLLNKITTDYLNKDANIVVSDLRFMHEYIAIQEFMDKHNDGNVVVKIVKIAHIGATRIYQQDKHNSETEHLSFQYDVILENEKNNKDAFLKKAVSVLVK